ncbi:helix-turn-helix transcriptional regulator [Egbenema bharatensis]|uniref:helix-turn-helix transcriptional regulator n=1 Tax=Egbenema bharatensis TaxID=3463334 RepID=UPI003A850559
MTIIMPGLDNSNINTQKEFRTASKTYASQSSCSQTFLPEKIIEDLVDGILILTEQKELIYANDCAQRILRQLNRDGLTHSVTDIIPGEIWHICQTLIESRYRFPRQHWLIESKVFVDSSIVFNARARWLKLEDRNQPCLLLSIHDYYQYIKNVAIEESEKYGLTSRERETWLLHRANYTYKQIASELCITPNTVKKHMKNIYLKKKAIDVSQED